VELCRIERKDMQYLYTDNGLYYFMDMETYEQLELSKDQVGDAMDYLMENSTATIDSVNGKIIAVNPPLFVELKVTECEPAVRGDTSKSAMKSAKLETGLVVKVPLFVSQDDIVRIDTRTGEYLERV
jgi:elongation factor P